MKIAVLRKGRARLLFIWAAAYRQRWLLQILGAQNIEKSIQEHFKKLSRGLMQPSYPVVYQAYKELYEIGPSVIPIIKSKLLEINWSNSKYKELSNYISGLFSLLHDLDEDEAKIVGDKIIANECPNHIKAILKSVFEFSLKNYSFQSKMACSSSQDVMPKKALANTIYCTL